jgi:hypothetical protein
MPNKPSPESIAKAARLRAQIDELTDPGAKPANRAPAASGEKPKLSPREFIQQQMNKLDKKK